MLHNIAKPNILNESEYPKILSTMFKIIIARQSKKGVQKIRKGLFFIKSPFQFYHTRKQNVNIPKKADLIRSAFFKC